MKLALLLVVVGALAGFAARTSRAALALAFAGGVVLWLAIVAYSAFDIPLNEPEWWGGLAITCSLVALGTGVGRIVRARRGRLTVS